MGILHRVPAWYLELWSETFDSRQAVISGRANRQCVFLVALQRHSLFIKHGVVLHGTRCYSKWAAGRLSLQRPWSNFLGLAWHFSRQFTAPRRCLLSLPLPFCKLVEQELSCLEGSILWSLVCADGTRITGYAEMRALRLGTLFGTCV